MSPPYFLTYQNSKGNINHKQKLSDIERDQVRNFRQIRKIEAYKGQKHMPGFYYMRAMRELVAYESRLEMVTLLQLDYNPSTSWVISQPFILHYIVGKTEYTHVPDYLSITETDDVTVIDVKPKKFVNDKENQRAFEATASACSSAGWTYSVQSEPHLLFLENLRWLAGFRRHSPIIDLYAETLIETCQAKALPLRELVSSVGHPAVVRPILFHLLFHRSLWINMYAQFTNGSIIDLPRGAFSHGA